MDAGRTDEPHAGLIDQAARRAKVIEPLWRAARSWTTALVLALFPFLFIIDGAVETRLSPVLPGLAVLLLLIVGLPLLVVELTQCLYRRKGLPWQAVHATRSMQNGRAAMVVASVWLVLWFAVGT